MASDASRDRYQAIAVPDPRVEVWTAETDIAPMGPHTGQPVPDTGTETQLALKSIRRDRAGTEDDLNIVTQVGGLPGLSAAPGAATLRWKRDADDADQWRGWIPPYLMLHQHGFSIEDANDFYRNPHAVVADGSLMIAYEKENTTAPTYSIPIRRWLHDDYTSTAATAIAGLTNASNRALPCLVRLPGNRVVCFTCEDHEDGSSVVVSAHATENEATSTWTRMHDNVLPNVIDTSSANVRRMRADYRNGQILLVIALRDTTRTNSADYFLQYVSIDGGYHFELVDTWPDTANVGGAAHDVKADSDGFHVAWVDISDGVARHVVIGSGRDVIRNANTVTIDDTGDEWGTVSGTPEQIGDADCTIALAEDGVWYAYRSHQVGGGAPGIQSAVFQSRDRGRTWSQLGVDVHEEEARWWRPDFGASITYDAKLRHYHAVAYEGAIWLVGQHAPYTSTLNASIRVLTLGGYDSLAHEPGVQPADYTWVPIDLPGDVGWTTSASGTTDSVSGGALLITETGSGGTHYYTYNRGTVTPYVRGGQARFFTSDSKSGAADEDQTCFIECREADSIGNHGFRWKITADATNIWVFDGDTTTTWNELGTVSITSGSQVDVRWVFHAEDDGSNPELSVWYRRVNDGMSAPWLPIVEQDTLTDNGVAASNSIVRFGANLDTGDEAQWTMWWDWPREGPTYTGNAENLLGMTNPDDLLCRPYSARTTWLVDSVEVSASGGPTHTGEAWTVSTAYEFPLSNLLDPSPRRPFKSAAASGAGEQVLALRWSDVGDAALGSDVLVLGFYGSTVSRVLVELYDDDTSSWVNTETVNLYLGDVGWAREGNVVVPGSAGSANPLLRHAEFDGAYWSFDNADPRVISRSTGGKWNTATTKHPVLMLDDVDDTEGSSGTSGRIVPLDAVVLVSLDSTSYSGVRLRIPDPSSTSIPEPPDDTWAIGHLFVGHLEIHAEDQDWGRTLEHAHIVDVDEGDDGHTRTRKRGPRRRAFTFAWGDAVDTLHASTDADDPDYHLLDSTDGDPLALARSTPWQVAGIADWLGGGEKTFLYLPRVEAFSGSDVQVLRRRHEHIHARLEDGIRLETVQGDEGSDEVIRIATVSGIEEV